MPRKAHTPEQIIAKLGEIEVQLAQGNKAGQACRQAGISEHNHYKWKKQYGGVGGLGDFREITEKGALRDYGPAPDWTNIDVRRKVEKAERFLKQRVKDSCDGDLVLRSVYLAADPGRIQPASKMDVARYVISNEGTKDERWEKRWIVAKDKRELASALRKILNR
jgi:hypothetical protein